MPSVPVTVQLFFLATKDRIITLEADDNNRNCLLLKVGLCLPVTVNLRDSALVY